MLNALANVSIIVPTYHEVENLPRLVTQLSTLKKNFLDFEVIIVDDNSNDGTVQCIQQFQQDYSWLRLHVRNEMPPDLSRSVLTGLNQATYDNLLVMDADLSHSPEFIVQLLTALQSPKVDFVIGSRFTSGGTIEESWSSLRRLYAQVAKTLVKKLVPVNDPLSGFFCLRKTTFLRGSDFNPVGYKIGLELMVKCQCQHIIEVPIHFADRQYGKSKLNWRQQLNYLIHLRRLYEYKRKNSIVKK